MVPRLALLILVGACGFRGPGPAAEDDGPIADAATIDAAIADGGVPGIDSGTAPLAFCPNDAHLRLCYSFDQATLPAMLPDEGVAVVDAQLTNVQSMASPNGRAATLGATSEIWIPMIAAVTNIQAFEVWFRYSAELGADGAREGIVDSNVVPPNISLFFYRADPTHTLRCGIGGQVEVWNATLMPNRWFYAACVCDAGRLTMYLDGVQIGQTAGACGSGGAFVADGFTIGSNNNGAAASVDSQLVGAIDGVRLWDVTLTPAQVCKTAGLCP